MKPARLTDHVARNNVLAALTVAAALMAVPTVGHAQEAAESEETELEVTYDNAIRFEYGPRYALEIVGALQGRFEFLSRGERADQPSESSSRFFIRRGRLGFQGHIFSENVEYEIELEISRSGAYLLDGIVDFTLDPDWFAIQVGVARRPTSRQFLTSMTKQALSDRAPTNSAFNQERDIGVTFHNGTKGMFEYALAIVNGTTSDIEASGQVQVDPTTGEGEITSFRQSNIPDEFKPAAVLRLGFNWVDDTGCDTLERTDKKAYKKRCRPSGYVEGDIERSNWQFGVGASGMGELDLDEDDTTEVLTSADLYVKGEGFWFTVAGHFQRIMVDAPDNEQNIDKIGLHTNASYAIPTGSVILQPVLAYTMIDEEGEGNVRHYAGGALNVHIIGHHLKFIVDAAAIINEDGDPDTDHAVDARVITQFLARF